MLFRRFLRHRAHRYGLIAVSVVFLLQAFAVGSMSGISTDQDVIVICTGSGMKTLSLSDLGLDADGLDQPYPGIALSDDTCARCPLAHNVAITASARFVPATDLGSHAPQAPPASRPLAGGYSSIQQARAPPSHV